MVICISDFKIVLTVADDSTRISNMDSNEKRGRFSHNKGKAEIAKTVAPSLIQEVFDYWKLVMGKKRAVLDSKRSRDIGWAIAIYGVDGAKEAIDGCKLSPFHMGDNDRDTVYNDVTLIFRDAERIERFQERAELKSAKDKWVES